MNSTEFMGKGYQKLEKLKQLFLSLTDSDLLLLEEKQDEILGKLHTKFNKARSEKRRLIPVA
jgi:hypothetical protein